MVKYYLTYCIRNIFDRVCWVKWFERGRKMRPITFDSGVFLRLLNTESVACRLFSSCVVCVPSPIISVSLLLWLYFFISPPRPHSPSSPLRYQPYSPCTLGPLQITELCCHTEWYIWPEFPYSYSVCLSICLALSHSRGCSLNHSNYFKGAQPVFLPSVSPFSRFSANLRQSRDAISHWPS